MARILSALLCLLLLGAAAPATRDWRRTVVESEAGWTFGRPGAPLLTEYASFGCPHCAHYAAEAGPAIDRLVKAGKLRFSWRPFLIFPHDRATTVLARCVAPPRRLAFIEAVMAAQADIKARLKAANASDAERQRLFEAELAGPEAEAGALASAGGLKALAGAHGLAPKAADACLADAAHHRWVTDADIAARVAKVAHTPTFEWNGKRLGQDSTPASLLALLPR